MCQSAFALEDLSSYKPGWFSTFITYGLPVLTGLLFLWIMGGVTMNWAANIIATILFVCFITALCAGIGCAIGLAVAKHNKHNEKTLKIVSSIIAGFIGFLFAADHSIQLADDASNAVGWLIRIALCAAIIVGLHFLNMKPNIGKELERLCFQIPVVKSTALKRQSQEIERYADSYYVLLNYKNIMQNIFDTEEKSRESEIKKETDTVLEEKEDDLKACRANRDIAIANALATEKSEYEEKLNQINHCKRQYQEKLDFDKSKIADYELRIAKIEQEYNKSIEKAKEEVKNASAQLTNLIKDLIKITKKPDFEQIKLTKESMPLAPCIYICGKVNSDGVQKALKLEHNEKPSLLLYQQGSHSDKIYKFLIKMIIAINFANDAGCYTTSVVDQTNNAKSQISKQDIGGSIQIYDKPEEQAEMLKHIECFSDNILKAQSGREGAWDSMMKVEYFRNMLSPDEKSEKYGCKIVIFLMPQQIGSNKRLINNVFEYVERYHDRGFLPFFLLPQDVYEHERENPDTDCGKLSGLFKNKEFNIFPNIDLDQMCE